MEHLLAQRRTHAGITSLDDLVIGTFSGTAGPTRSTPEGRSGSLGGPGLSCPQGQAVTPVSAAYTGVTLTGTSSGATTAFTGPYTCTNPSAS